MGRGKQRVNQIAARKPGRYKSPVAPAKVEEELETARLRITACADRLVTVRDPNMNVYLFHVPGNVALTYIQTMQFGEVLAYQKADRDERDRSFKEIRTGRSLPFIEAIGKAKALSVPKEDGEYAKFVALLEDRMPSFAEAPPIKGVIKGIGKLATIREGLPAKAAAPAPPPAAAAWPATWRDWNITPPEKAQLPNGRTCVPHAEKTIACPACAGAITLKGGCVVKDGAIGKVANIKASPATARCKGAGPTATWYCSEACQKAGPAAPPVAAAPPPIMEPKMEEPPKNAELAPPQNGPESEPKMGAVQKPEEKPTIEEECARCNELEAEVKDLLATVAVRDIGRALLKRVMAASGKDDTYKAGYVQALLDAEVL